MNVKDLTLFLGVGAGLSRPQNIPASRETGEKRSHVENNKAPIFNAEAIIALQKTKSFTS